MGATRHSTRTATCSRCRTVAHKCRCPITSTHHQNESSKNLLQQHIDKTQTKRALPASQIIQSNTRCPGCDGICKPKTRSGMGLVQELQKAVQNSTTTAHESTRGQEGSEASCFNPSKTFFGLKRNTRRGCGSSLWLKRSCLSARITGIRSEKTGSA